MTYHDFFLSLLRLSYKMCFRGTHTMRQTLYQQSPLQKKVDYDNRGIFIMFQEFMHSWVGYELVKVLLAFGLSPKVREDLKD